MSTLSTFFMLETGRMNEPSKGCDSHETLQGCNYSFFQFIIKKLTTTIGLGPTLFQAQYDVEGPHR